MLAVISGLTDSSFCNNSSVNTQSEEPGHLHLLRLTLVLSLVIVRSSKTAGESSHFDLAAAVKATMRRLADKDTVFQGFAAHASRSHTLNLTRLILTSSGRFAFFRSDLQQVALGALRIAWVLPDACMASAGPLVAHRTKGF